MILAVANLLANNNKCQICYGGQISLQNAAVYCSFSDNLEHLEVTVILLATVHQVIVYVREFLKTQCSLGYASKKAWRISVCSKFLFG